MWRSLLPAFLVGLLIAPSLAAGIGYSRNQQHADVALAAFGEANLQCQLWTNWQKMCSRTGEGGAVACSTDPDRPVAPSEPFCTAGEAAPPTRAQVKSFERFCKLRRTSLGGTP